MVQQRIQNASEALKRAKEMDGDVFLGSFTMQEIERTGFDTSVFDPFSRVDVYLMWDGFEFVLKYIFDDDVLNPYYEKAHEIGSEEDVLEVVQEYLEVGGE